MYVNVFLRRLIIHLNQFIVPTEFPSGPFAGPLGSSEVSAIQAPGGTGQLSNAITPRSKALISQN